MNVNLYKMNVLKDIKKLEEQHPFPNVVLVNIKKSNAGLTAPIDKEFATVILPSSDIHSPDWKENRHLRSFAERLIDTQSIAVFFVSPGDNKTFEFCREFMSFMEYIATGMNEGTERIDNEDYVDSVRHYIEGHLTHMPVPTGTVKSEQGRDVFRWDANITPNIKNTHEYYLKVIRKFEEEPVFKDWLYEQAIKKEYGLPTPSAKRARESFADDKGLLLLDTAGGWPVAFAVDFSGSAVVVLPEKADAATSLFDKINADTSERKGFELLQHVFSKDAPPQAPYANNSTPLPNVEENTQGNVSKHEIVVKKLPDSPAKLTYKAYLKVDGEDCELTILQLLRFLVLYIASNGENQGMIFKHNIRKNPPEGEIKMLLKNGKKSDLPGHSIFFTDAGFSKNIATDITLALETIMNKCRKNQDDLQSIQENILGRKKDDRRKKENGWRKERLNNISVRFTSIAMDELTNLDLEEKKKKEEKSPCSNTTTERVKNFIQDKEKFIEAIKEHCQTS